AKIYNSNYEISEFEILRNHGKSANFAKHLYQGSLENIRSGDVVGKLKGDVENGVIKIKFGEFLIYGKNGKVKNGKNLEFENAFFTIYKGRKEFIVQ
ncbi:MAG: endonuclease/exonuclease/phosphatase family protein, partial [Campylobacter sp.]|nr:endonuclease/exonuclease/phosphatase family protein [Campylobacter sp.]